MSAALLGAVTLILLSSSCHSLAQTAASAQARYMIDTPLRVLLQNPQARAIINRYAPGIGEGVHYYLVAAFTPRQLSSMSGSITTAALSRLGRELAQVR